MKKKLIFTAHDKLIFSALKSEFGLSVKFIRPLPDEPHRSAANEYFLSALLIDDHNEASQYLGMLGKDLKKFIIDKYPILLDL